MAKNSLFKPDLISLCRLLNRHKVRYLLIGAQAGILYGLPRTTLDVDIFIQNTKENCERLLEALKKVGFGIAKEISPDEIANKSVFIFADQIRVDIFIKPWGLKKFEDSYKHKVIFTFGNIKIPAVSLDDLIKSKNTDRAEDQEDIKVLRKLKK